MSSTAAFLARDRRKAIADGIALPDRATGSILFADISGYTPLTAAIIDELGPRRGVDFLTGTINATFTDLINQIHGHGGSVIGFGGDALTCWFPQSEAGNRVDAGQAVSCAFALQQAIAAHVRITTPLGKLIALTLKTVVVSGATRRFQVGDSTIQYLDVLAGRLVAEMAHAEACARAGEVIANETILLLLKNKVIIRARRTHPLSGQRFAVVAAEPGRLPSKTAPISSQIPALTDLQVRPWLLSPVYERLQEQESLFLAEIRPVTSLFLRFSGLDYDRDELAGEKLDAFIRRMQGQISRAEGHLLKLTIGDKGSYLLAAFGALKAHDDDLSRAVDVARRLRQISATFDFIASVQIGIGHGRVLAGAFGSPERCAYDLLGDEVNLAARLMQRALPGQILVSRAVMTKSKTHFTFDDLGPTQLKGKDHPVPIYSVRDAHVRTPYGSISPAGPSLVGREVELRAARRVLNLTEAGRGQILHLAGPAGIGKSALAQAVVDMALQGGFQVLPGHCQSAQRDVAYHPWRQLFRALFELVDHLPANETPQSWQAYQLSQVEAIIADVNPDWSLLIPLLGDLLGISAPDNETTALFDPSLRQGIMIVLASEIVQTWAKEVPGLIILEDMHWLDEASGALLRGLARLIEQSPVCLLLTNRLWPADEGPPPWAELTQQPHYHLLALGPLTAEAVLTLISDQLRAEPSTLAGSLIQAKAQGNPFFVEELVAAMRESGHLGQREAGPAWDLSAETINLLQAHNCLTKDPFSGQWLLAGDAPLSSVELGLPDSIHSLILTRFDRLTEAQKIMLKVASVIGPEFEAELLAQAHPYTLKPETLSGELAALQARSDIRPLPGRAGTAFAFRHHLTHEVIYQTLLDNQRHLLHRRVGHALETLLPEAVERMAYHFSHSDDQAKAVQYLDLAARKAQREYANETALNYYRQALALEERWEWRQGQVEILHLLGRREAEEAVLAALEAHPTAPIFEPAYWRGRYYEAIGDYVRAQTAIERAVAVCRDEGNVVGEVKCLGQLGLIARRRGNYEEAKDWYQQAIAGLEAQVINRPEEAAAFTQILNGLGNVYRQQGEYDEAKQCCQQALALSHKNGNRRGEAEALNDLGVMAYYQRNFAEALKHHQKALSIRRAIGDRTGEGTCLFNLALVTCDAGDYSQAQEYFLESLDIHQATGNQWEEINVWNSTGNLFLLVGDLPAAKRYLQQGLALSQEIGDEAGQAYSLASLGLVTRELGDLTTAEKLFADGLAIVQAQTDRYAISYFFSHLGVVSLQAGRFDEAVEQAKAALAMRQELGLQLWTTADLVTLAAVHLATDKITLALDYAQQALAILEDCNGQGPEFPHRDYFTCYQVLSAAGQPDAAHVALQAAYKLVMTQADKITDPAMRQSFLERVALNRQIIQTFTSQLGARR